MAIPYRLLADPDNEEQWLVEVDGVVLRIDNVSLQLDTDLDQMKYNYSYDIISGETIAKETLDSVVAQIIIEQSEYHQGRAEYLAAEKE